jgi:phosphoribosylanthranilate isomerase
VLVQIYGITTQEDAEMVNALAPDNVGVVVDEGFQTWDGVDEATARLIVSELSDVTVVALSLAVERERILRTVEVVSPSVLHLVRAEDEMPAELLALLRDELDPIKLILTVPVLNEESLAIAEGLSVAADYLLLDTAHPQSGQVGATGLAHDWGPSRRIAELSLPQSSSLVGSDLPTYEKPSGPSGHLALTLKRGQAGTTTVDERIPKKYDSLLNGLAPRI